VVFQAESNMQDFLSLGQRGGISIDDGNGGPVTSNSCLTAHKACDNPHDFPSSVTGQTNTFTARFVARNGEFNDTSDSFVVSYECVTGRSVNGIPEC
jgi:hypothetical protein